MSDSKKIGGENPVESTTEVSIEYPEIGAELKLAAEPERLIAEVDDFSHEITADLARLASDNSSEAVTAITELEIIAQEVVLERESIWKRLAGIVSAPVETVKEYFEARQEAALKIPDNPKVHEQLMDEMESVYKILDKRMRKVKKQLAAEFPDRDIDKDLKGFGATNSLANILYIKGGQADHWRSEEIAFFSRFNHPGKFIESKNEQDIGIRSDQLSYDDGVLNMIADVATTYERSAKTKIVSYYSSEAGLRDRIQRCIYKPLEIACYSNDIPKILFWWQKLPQHTTSLAMRIVEMTARSYLVENFVPSYDAAVRPELVELKSKADNFFSNLEKAFQDVPLLREATKDGYKHFSRELFSRDELVLINHYGVEIMDIWPTLGAPLQKEITEGRLGAEQRSVTYYKYVLGMIDLPANEWDELQNDWVSAPVVWQLYKRGRGSLAITRQMINRFSESKFDANRWINVREPTDPPEDIHEVSNKFFSLVDTRVDASYWADGRIIKILLHRSRDFDKMASAMADIPLLSPKNSEGIIGNFGKLIDATPEKRAQYVGVIEALANSPSQEIQRVVGQLVEQILSADNPTESYQKIEQIFIKNNLPLVGKIFKIFEALYPAKKLTETLQGNYNLSPYLRGASEKRRTYTIFTDLLRVHVDSGNRSLRQYLEILQEGELLFTILENKDGQAPSSDQIKKLQHFIAKLNTIFHNSQSAFPNSNGSDIEISEAISWDTMQTNYRLLQNSLGVKEGQSTNERIAEMFLQPLGYKTIDEACEAMKRKKSVADQRGRKLANASLNFTLEDGDLLKGVDAQYISSILQNGSVAKEYLGASSATDFTPFDTDLAMIPKGGAKDGFEKARSRSDAEPYGTIMLVMKNRGQYTLTTDKSVGDYSTDKYELFGSGKISEQHYGIRTGFAATEIDFLICKEKDEKNKQNLFLEIAQNGYYIPVVDGDGTLIFTPAQYDELRSIYNGLTVFDGEVYKVDTTIGSPLHRRNIDKIKSTLADGERQVDILTAHIRSAVEAVLSAQGIKLKEPFDTGIIGAELIDTGSTGRHTNLPGNFDFDLVLKLDRDDESKMDSILVALREKLQPQKDESHVGNSEGDIHQLRFFGAVGLGGAPLDIDVAFVKKSELAVYGSHDAVKDKLANIKNNLGDESYQTVLANIVLAKEILKKGEAYKKQEHGGLGGIGVENWILANGGNMQKAFESFRAAAYQGRKRLSLAEFKQKHTIIDPGVNVKFLKHDNFIELLTDAGYVRMLETIDRFLTGKEKK